MAHFKKPFQSLIFLLLNSSLFQTIFYAQNVSPAEYVLFSKAAPADKYQYYNLDYERVTTVVIVGEFDQDYLNFMRMQYLIFGYKIKLQILIGDVLDPKKMNSTEYLEMEAAKWVRYVITHGIDGINLDFEEQYCEPALKQGMTYFVKYLYESLKSHNPRYLVTFDVPHDPEASGRCEDWAEISKSVDYLYIMGYDAMDGHEIAQCTDKIGRITTGIDNYMSNLKIRKSKLVQLVPWYNPMFKCRDPVPDILQPGEDCHTKIWGAEGQTQLGICDTHKKIDIATNHGYLSQTTANLPNFDLDDKCFFITFKDTFSKNTFRLYYDTAETLKLKFRKGAIKNELAGIGFWWANAHDNTDEDCGEKFLDVYWEMMKQVHYELTTGKEMATSQRPVVGPKLTPSPKLHLDDVRDVKIPKMFSEIFEEEDTFDRL